MMSLGWDRLVQSVYKVVAWERVRFSISAIGLNIGWNLVIKKFQPTVIAIKCSQLILGVSASSLSSSRHNKMGDSDNSALLCNLMVHGCVVY